MNVIVSNGLMNALDAYCERTGMKRTDAMRSLIKLGLRAYNEQMAEGDA